MVWKRSGPKKERKNRKTPEKTTKKPKIHLKSLRKSDCHHMRSNKRNMQGQMKFFNRFRLFIVILNLKKKTKKWLRAVPGDGFEDSGGTG